MQTLCCCPKHMNLPSYYNTGELDTHRQCTSHSSTSLVLQSSVHACIWSVHVLWTHKPSTVYTRTHTHTQTRTDTHTQTHACTQWGTALHSSGYECTPFTAAPLTQTSHTMHKATWSARTQFIVSSYHTPLTLVTVSLLAVEFQEWSLIFVPFISK